MPMLIMSQKDLESVRQAPAEPYSEAQQAQDLKDLLALLEKRTRQARRYKELLKLADKALNGYTKMFLSEFPDRVEERTVASTRLMAELKNDGL